MYDPNASHYKIVWPIAAPPVYTGNWTNADWLRYCAQFRPKDYYGDQFDKDAWAAYLKWRGP